MSKYKIREDKICLNCGAYVECKYCPQCGQENRETRESFFHLVLEFVFDLVHFDSSFWKTTRYLLFSPAKLSLEYMDGKRKLHVNPVKLYIFISFVAFFLPGILPTPYKEKKKDQMEIKVEEKNTKLDENFGIDIDEYGIIRSLAELDSVHNSKSDDKRIKKSEYKIYKELFKTKEDPDRFKDEDGFDLDDIFRSGIRENKVRITGGYGDIEHLAELDSIHSSKPENERISFIKYNFYKSLLQLKENITDKQKQNKAFEFIVHNFSKILFVYMPVFAFWMWLFNLNKRRYYFDSGIFTLHFFSFWLLLVTFFNVLSCILVDWLDYEVITYLLILPVGLLYITFYFFRANRLFYKDRRWLANIKAFILFHINTFFILVILLGYLLFAFVRLYE